MKTTIAAVLALAVFQPQDAIDLRGRAQTLHLYGPRTGEPVIVSSGDGGWIHLGPHIASFLASRGFFVVGFDVKAYSRASHQETQPSTPRRNRTTTPLSRSSRAAARARSPFSSVSPKGQVSRCSPRRTRA